MTKVINLFGSPNSGKSTVTGGLFYYLKMDKVHCEMVREYIKNWVWEGRRPNKYDQPYIFGKQLKYESLLYNKVDYIITDSPFILAAYYERIHEKTQIVLPAAQAFMKHANDNGVEYINFWLDTIPEIDDRGRHHSKEMIEMIAKDMKSWLVDELKLKLHDVDCPLDKRVEFILDKIKG